MNITIGRGRNRQTVELPSGGRMAQADKEGGEERNQYETAHDNVCTLLGISTENFNRRYRHD